MSVASMANWAADFVVSISFRTLLGALGNAGTFFLFFGRAVIALLYFQLLYFQLQVPGTTNRSLEDIERDLALLVGAMGCVAA
jgi:hypothetical protein